VMQIVWSVNSRGASQKSAANHLKLNTNKTELGWTGSRHNLSSEFTWRLQSMLQLDNDMINLISFLVRLLMQTWVLTGMF